MGMSRPCAEPGCENTTHGHRCAPCNFKFRKKASDSRARHCACGRRLGQGTAGNKCQECLYPLPGVRSRLEAEAARAPSLPRIPVDHGEVAILPDLHIPWHDPAALMQACEAASALGVRVALIPGDLLHMDKISKHQGVGKTVHPTEELVAAKAALDALRLVFERIVVIPGNHDQRLEKWFERTSKSKSGAEQLENVAALLNADATVLEDVANKFIAHFLGGDGIEIHPLPQIEWAVDGSGYKWLIQHPGSCRKTSPSLERAFSHKFRKPVIQGHSHLWACGFDDSGTDPCCNIGHLSDDTKYRYVRERPSVFPRTVKGYAMLLKDEDVPGGYVWPIPIHDRYATPQRILKRLQK